MKINEFELNEINETISEMLKVTENPDDILFKKIISRAVSKNLSAKNYTLNEKQNIITSIYCRIRGYDILQPLMDDNNVTEIMVNGPDSIFYEQKGVLHKYNKVFENKTSLNDVIFRIFSEENKTISETEPVSDVRLKDGSRANAVLFPVAPDGPVLTIRKFTGIIPNMESLISCGFLKNEHSNYLTDSILKKKNIFISGGTGTGKTTFLNVLSAYIPADERIITIEDQSELKLQDTPNLVRLESRNALPEGKSEIGIADLIRCALRMRPDRIIVGEVRGREAADMLWAMNTGHMGSMSTGHSNSAIDMLARLCIMVRQASPLPVDVINSLIANAIDIIVHLKRRSDKSRCIDEIIEVRNFSKGEYSIEKIF